jgi:hypothetical protein
MRAKDRVAPRSSEVVILVQFAGRIVGYVEQGSLAKSAAKAGCYGQPEKLTKFEMGESRLSDYHPIDF